MKIKISKIKKKDFLSFLQKYWIIVLLTIVGSFLRLYNFRSNIMFLGDQARDSFIVRHFVKTFDPILVGPTTSVGKIQLGPFYYYFMAPFLLLSNFDPIGPALAVAFVGIITIPILYFVGIKMFGRTTAIISSILFTFSNVVISNTRFSWNPNPMPLAILMLIYFIYQVYEKKKYKNIIGVFISYAIALQLHYMALMIAPALVLLGIMVIRELSKKDRKIFSKYLIRGIAVFLLFQTPLIVFDLMKDFLNSRGILEFFQSGHHTESTYFYPRISQRIKESLGMILGLESNVNKIIDISSYLSLIFVVMLTFIKRQSKSLQIISSLFFSGLISLIIYSGDIYEHYLGFTYVTSIVLIAYLFAYLWQKHFLGKIALLIILPFLIFVNIKTYRHYKPQGWTMDETKELSMIIANDIGRDKAYNIVLLDNTKDYRAMQYRYFLDKTNIKDYGNFNVDILYLISEFDYENIGNLEIRELEEFFQTRLLRMTTEENAKFLENKIIKEWNIVDGPNVYKLSNQDLLLE